MSLLRALLVFVALTPSVASAHKPSDSYLRLDATGAHLGGEWAIALRDFETVVGLDANGDRAITWAELKARRDALTAHAGARLALQVDNQPCALAFDDLLVDEYAGDGFAVMRFATGCPAQRPVEVRYGFLFDLDPQHRGLLHLRYPDTTISAVLSPDRPRQRFAPGSPSRITTIASFLREGVIHIWLGIDHILFLLCILLPAVLRREAGGWRAVGELRTALWETTCIVTAFTVAHSITLCLAALEIISLPGRFVESAIAASIVIAALNNVYPLFRKRLWAVTFAFGLLHGFGFASVLRELGLEQGALALSLLGFNLGVELGQLCVVLIWLPLAWTLRRLVTYRYVVLYSGSLAVALVGAWWLVERIAY